ncbi:MAG: hypothetical protein IJ563_12875 [Selenomonadaceae bacterium]|nr:hypothetical protein [Selenomonadaceae bacterium]
MRRNTIFIIVSKESWDRFISGNIKFGSEASAQASNWVSGGTFADAKVIAHGVWVYQLEKKGLVID